MLLDSKKINRFIGNMAMYSDVRYSNDVHIIILTSYKAQKLRNFGVYLNTSRVALKLAKKALKNRIWKL